jgi:predicted GIY-YIG superfamily endonuclease
MDKSEKKIYVLKLQKGKYYVGRTNNVMRRLEEHKSHQSKAAEWTKMYNVIDVVDVKVIASEGDEITTTYNYMHNYGIDNVRGGDEVKVYLTYEEKAKIKRSIWLMKGWCIKCGRDGHMGPACTRLEDVYGDVIKPQEVIKEVTKEVTKEVFTCEKCNKEYKTKGGYDKHVLKCGITTEGKSDVKKEVKGEGKKKYTCEKCGKEGHVGGAWWCVVGTPKENEIKCAKCEEYGHYAAGCRK